MAEPLTDRAHAVEVPSWLAAVSLLLAIAATGGCVYSFGLGFGDTTAVFFGILAAIVSLLALLLAAPWRRARRS